MAPIARTVDRRHPTGAECTFDVIALSERGPKTLETTALGAAYLAGLAVGYWKDDSELRANWQVDRRFEPAQDRARMAEMRDAWDKAVARSKAWA